MVGMQGGWQWEEDEEQKSQENWLAGLPDKTKTADLNQEVFKINY
mgnify:CR=1 FL=1